MTKLATASFTGKSGKEYSFNVYPFDTNFKEIPAVYIVTNRHKNKEDKYRHTIIYISHTDNLKKCFENHDKTACFRRNMANVICVNSFRDEEERLNVEDDLIKGNSSICKD